MKEKDPPTLRESLTYAMRLESLYKQQQRDARDARPRHVRAAQADAAIRRSETGNSKTPAKTDEMNLNRDKEIEDLKRKMEELSAAFAASMMRTAQPQQSTGQQQQRGCYNCGDVSHIRRNCPYQNMIQPPMSRTQEAPLSQEAVVTGTRMPQHCKDVSVVEAWIISNVTAPRIANDQEGITATPTTPINDKQRIKNSNSRIDSKPVSYTHLTLPTNREV